MEPKKAITTGLHRTMGGWGFKTRGGKKKCWRKMAKRIMKKRGRNGRESKSEKEERGEWKNEKNGQWSQYSCHGGDKQRQRLSDKNSTYKRQLRGTKAEWQPIPAWRRVSRNPVIHANLYDDVAEPH